MTKNQFLATVPYLMGFGLTNRNLDYIIKTTDIDPKKINKIKKLEKIMYILNEKCEVNAIYSKNKLVNAVKLRKINVLDEIVYLDDENMIEYLKNLADTIERSVKHNVFVYDDDLQLDLSDVNISIISNEEYAFLKRDKYYTRSHSSLYYQITSEEIISSLTNDLLSIFRGSNFFKSSKDDLVKFIRNDLVNIV